MLIVRSLSYNHKLQTCQNSITNTGVHQLKRSTTACERHGPIHNAKIRWAVHSSRSCSNNESDDVSFVGRYLALLPSRCKSQSGVLTKPGQLIGLSLPINNWR